MVDTPDFATQLASLIGLGVGIDYSLFVVTRYRAEVRNGLDRDRAVEMAIDTAGRTVMFAAITVVIALLGLLLLGLSFMQGVALGAATAVLATMLAALTIIPALIGGSGNFIDGVLHEFDERGGFRFWGTKRRLTLPGHDWRSRRAVRRDRKRAEGAGWERWSHMVQRRPWIAVIVALAVLIGLALPATKLRLGSSDAGVDPPGTTPRKAYDLIAEGFGAGTNGSFLLVAQLAQKGDKAAAQQIADAVRADKDFTFVAPPAVSPDGQVATISAYPRTGPQEAATTDTLKRLRDSVVPAIEGKTNARVEVGGFTASNEDFSRVVADKLPLFVGVVVLFSALLLLARVPLGDHPDQGRDPEPAVDRRRAGVRDPDLPGRARSRTAGHRHGADRVLRPGADVRHRVRAEHGLRGLPDLPRPRGMGAHGRRLGLGRARPADHRQGDHRRRLDHDPRLRVLRPRRRPHHQAVRDRAGQRRLLRRGDHPLPAGPGADGDLRPRAPGGCPRGWTAGCRAWRSRRRTSATRRRPASP